MKIIEDAFKMYKDHLTGDEEDILVVVFGLLDDCNHQDLDKLIRGLNHEEKFEMLVLYLYEKLKEKVIQEGIGHIGNIDDQNGPILH